MPFAYADLATGPLDLVIPIVFLVLVVALIVGAVFLIKYIIKKVKAKQ